MVKGAYSGAEFNLVGLVGLEITLFIIYLLADLLLEHLHGHLAAVGLPLGAMRGGCGRVNCV